MLLLRQMLGLLLFVQCTGDAAANAVLMKIAACLRAAFGGPSGPQALAALGSQGMNGAILHSVALVYANTSDAQWLALCQSILEAMTPAVDPSGTDYLNNALKNQDWFRGRYPRWEGMACGASGVVWCTSKLQKDSCLCLCLALCLSLLPVCKFRRLYFWLSNVSACTRADSNSYDAAMGFSELALTTGEQKYATAYAQIWWNLCQLERHTNGAMMAGERAVGDAESMTIPQETCIAVTWGAMCVEFLRLTGDPIAADELEWTLWNTALFSLSPGGRWCVYNNTVGTTAGSVTTALAASDGQRLSAMVYAVGQTTPESSDLTCCSVNGPRFLGLLSEWALMGTADGVAVLLYAPLTISVAIPSAVVTIKQTTTYPYGSNQVVLQVTPSVAATFTVALRIPVWSKRTTVILDGRPVTPVAPRSMLKLRQLWTAAGHSIVITFDFRLRAWLRGTTQAEQQHPPCTTGRDGTTKINSGSEDGLQASQHERFAAAVIPAVAGAAPIPDPVWDSTSNGQWAPEGKVFTGAAGQELVIGQPQPALGAGASTMMCWFSMPLPTASAGSIPMSFGVTVLHVVEYRTN